MLLALDPLHPLVPVVVWAARALTFFNVLVLLWLGLTVLLNAERRRLGTWLTGGGLLLGGACSVARASAQAAQPIELFAPLDIWWRASWLPFAGAAYLWSVVLTWYAGRLRTRAEWRSLVGLSLLGSITFLLLLGARPPEVDPDARRRLGVAAVLRVGEPDLSRLWRGRRRSRCSPSRPPRRCPPGAGLVPDVHGALHRPRAPRALPPG